MHLFIRVYALYALWSDSGFLVYKLLSFALFVGLDLLFFIDNMQGQFFWLRCFPSLRYMRSQIIMFKGPQIQIVIIAKKKTIFALGCRNNMRSKSLKIQNLYYYLNTIGKHKKEAVFLQPPQKHQSKKETAKNLNTLAAVMTKLSNFRKQITPSNLQSTNPPNASLSLKIFNPHYNYQL